jgi:MFS family permease
LTRGHRALSHRGDQLRRDSALALISSGTYVAGAFWPPIFEQVIANFGWRQAMLWYAIAEIVVVVPLAAIYFRAPPEVIHPAAVSGDNPGKARVLGWPPNAVFALMCGAGVLCCIPMRCRRAIWSPFAATSVSADRWAR